MKVKVLQPKYPGGGSEEEAEACLAWMLERLGELAPGSSDLVLLPEYANVPGLEDAARLRKFAEKQGRRFIERVKEEAVRIQCAVALGVVDGEGARWMNRGLLYDPLEDKTSTYDKIHLTDAETGDLGLTPGNEIRVFDHRGLRVAFAICFDLYFPEYCARLCSENVDIILCPSYQRSETAHRITLLAQARALDTGCHLIRSTYAMPVAGKGGHSLVATPEGTLLADAGSDPGVLTCDFDERRNFMKAASHGKPLIEHRKLMQKHRKPALYTS